MIAIDVIVVGSVGVDVYIRSTSTEVVIIEGEVTSIIPVKNEVGGIAYLTVVFDNDTDKSYNIKTYNDIDFTVNSKLIIEMYSYDSLFYDNNGCWYINQIIKVPGS